MPLLDARSDAAVRVLILTGAGEKASWRADISELALQTPVNGKEFSLFGQGVFHLLETMRKLRSARSMDLRCGGGCELALLLHHSNRQQNGELGQPEVKLGILPGYGGSQPAGAAVRQGCGARTLPYRRNDHAEEAAAYRVCESYLRAGELIPAAEAMAKKIIANGPLAVKFTNGSD